MKNDISPNKETVVFGNDSAVIRKYIAGIAGGRTLDCSDFADDTVLAGHVIIKKADGKYAPMPVTAAVAAKPAQGETPAVPAQPAKYSTLPAGASYAGVLYRSISKKNPAASIMTIGIVNPDMTPYPMTDILTAFTAACKISFEKDEEA